MELTEVRTPGPVWWTLGFEAVGPASRRRRTLEATAALVFAQALPGGVEPGPDDSRSYAKWLGQRLGPGVSACGSQDSRGSLRPVRRGYAPVNSW